MKWPRNLAVRKSVREMLAEKKKKKVEGVDVLKWGDEL
jgi:hypothetical protein